MYEYEGKRRFTYTTTEIAEKLLPNENDFATVAHNRVGAHSLRMRIPEARTQSAYVPGDLLATVARQSAGNLSGIIAEAIYAPRPALQLTEDEKRSLLKGALIFDIAWHEGRSSRPIYKKTKEVFTNGLSESQVITMRKERLAELEETSVFLPQPTNPPE